MLVASDLLGRAGHALADLLASRPLAFNPPRATLRRTIGGALLALTIIAGCIPDQRSPTDQAADWWAGHDRTIALCVIDHESGGDRYASNGHDFGIMQINRIHRSEFEHLTGKTWIPWIYDANLNGQFGRWLWNGGSGPHGWHQWTTAHGCGG